MYPLSTFDSGSFASRALPYATSLFPDMGLFIGGPPGLDASPIRLELSNPEFSHRGSGVGTPPSYTPPGPAKFLSFTTDGWLNTLSGGVLSWDAWADIILRYDAASGTADLA